MIWEVGGEIRRCRLLLKPLSSSSCAISSINSYLESNLNSSVVPSPASKQLPLRNFGSVNIKKYLLQERENQRFYMALIIPGAVPFA